MKDFTEVLESELNAAIYNEDREALKRFSYLIGENMGRIRDIDRDNSEIKSDVKTIAEVMKRGFEDTNRRFDMMFKFMSIGFSIITILIVIFKFVK